VAQASLKYLERSPAAIKLTYSSRGPYGLIWEFEGTTANGSITIEETREQVILHTIDIEPQRTGLGSLIIESLKQYSNQENKQLLIPAVMNLPFFSRFSWLSWSEPENDDKMWAARYYG